MKTYENFIKNLFKSEPEPEKETQEELDKLLKDAVENSLWWEFLDAIKKGANPNQETIHSAGSYAYTLLMTAINRRDFRMVDELIKHGADVYHQIKPNFDIYNWANKITSNRDRPKLKKIFLRYHPDLFEERELRKNASKYNL